MFGKPFLYYLVDELGRSIKWIGSTISRKNTPTPLDYTPDGWMDKSLQIQRHESYFGLFREFVPKLNFVRDAAAILRYFYYHLSVDAKLWMVILRRQTNGDHVDLFKGEIDFTQFSDKTLESGAGVVAVNCLDGGIPKYLKANEGTTYDIDLVDAEAVKVNFHGLGLYSKSFWNANNYPMRPAVGLTSENAVPMNFLRIDGKAGGFSTSSQIPGDPSSSTYEDYAIIRSERGNNTFDVVVEFDVVNNREIHQLTFYLWDGVGTTPIDPAYIVFNDATTHTAGSTIHVSISQTITILEGNHLALWGFVLFDGPPSSDNFITYNNLTGTTEGINAVPGSVVRGYTVGQMFDKLFPKVVEGNFLNRSTLLSQKNDYILVCEDELRGYPTPKYRTDFKKFFQFCRVQFMAGFGNNGRYGEIERLDYFFNTTQISNLGAVKGVKIEPYNEQLYSSIKIGYEDISLSDTNGANEPNNNLTFSTPLKRPGKTLELISPYAASMYLIEYLRIEKKDVSEDKVPGNKIFVVKIDRSTTNPDGSYNLLLHPSWTVTGLIDPTTAFNLDLTPKRLLKENGDFIASFCHRYENSRIAFTSSQKPIRMIADGLDEHNNEYVNTLGSPIFLPYQLSFDVALPMLTWDQLNAARSGTFAFEVRGQQYTGFAQDVKVKPATDEEQEMTVLLAPGNDLTTLINAE